MSSGESINAAGHDLSLPPVSAQPEASARSGSPPGASLSEAAYIDALLDTEKLLDAAGSLIVVFNRQGAIQRFNRTCQQATGYTENEVQNRCVWDFLLVPEEQVAMQGIFNQLRAGQTNPYYESTWLDKGGHRHVIAWSNTVLTNRAGRVDFIISSGLEVTEQHRSRRQLEGQYRQSHLLAEITQKIRHSLELDEILQTTVNEVHALLGCDRVFILKVPKNSAHAIELAAESMSGKAPQGPAQSLLQKPWPLNPLLHSAYIDHYRRQSVSVIDTVGGPGAAPELVSILKRIAVKSELAVPILTADLPEGAGADAAAQPNSQPSSGQPDSQAPGQSEGQLDDESEGQSEGQSDDESSPDSDSKAENDSRHTDTFWGLLIAHQCTQSRRWSPLEIDLMQQLANQIGVAINHAELLDHLEDLVRERTAKLTLTNQQLRREVEEHWRTESALRHSERQLRLVTNALPALVAYIDTRHRYRFNNYAYEAWYNIPYVKIKGRRVSDIVSFEVYQKMLPYLEQALTGEKVTYEAEMVQSSGDRLWASISYIPDVHDNQVRGLFSLVSDISDRKAAERMKDEFVSVVSHELRTPLTSVHGSLKLLATGRLGQLSDQGQQLLTIALKNTERLTRLLNDVLDLERIGSGRVRLNPVICNVSDLLHSAVEAMQVMADDYGIELIIQLDEATQLEESAPAEETVLAEGIAPAEKITSAKEGVQSGKSAQTEKPAQTEKSAQTQKPIESPASAMSVWAEPDQIMQTLTNLLSNAIKFSPQGSSVLIKARSQVPARGPFQGSKIEFSIKDAGRGIPSDKLETIFERFQQVDTSDARERGGTGLGLAICREIIQQHEGRIWVKSVHGLGSTFYFTLPVPPPIPSELLPSALPTEPLISPSIDPPVISDTNKKHAARGSVLDHE